jgi:hypothetical protein
MCAEASYRIVNIDSSLNRHGVTRWEDHLTELLEQLSDIRKTLKQLYCSTASSLSPHSQWWQQQVDELNLFIHIPWFLHSPGCKVQGTLIVIVLEVDTGSKSDQVLQTANVTLTTCIMQWWTTCLVLFIEKLQQTRFRLHLQCWEPLVNNRVKKCAIPQSVIYNHTDLSDWNGKFFKWAKKYLEFQENNFFLIKLTELFEIFFSFFCL